MNKGLQQVNEFLSILFDFIIFIQIFHYLQKYLVDTFELNKILTGASATFVKNATTTLIRCLKQKLTKPYTTTSSANIQNDTLIFELDTKK